MFDWVRPWLLRHKFTLADMTREHGYVFYATSPMWKDFCTWLPCFLWIDWPGYASSSKEIIVDGNTVVIQCWKGWCGDPLQHLPLPKSLKSIKFPGGVGAEVGIYTLVPPWKQPVPAVGAEKEELLRAHEFELPIDPKQAMSDFWARMHAHTKSLDRWKIWWADRGSLTNLGPPVVFSLYDKNFGDPLIENYSTPTYWTCKWMATSSYLKWRRKHDPNSTMSRQQLAAPPSMDPDDYVLKFSFAGNHYIWAGGRSDVITLDPDFGPGQTPTAGPLGVNP